MSELEAKVQKSIERLKRFEPEEGYYLAFSGGKDSVVCKALLEMSGCKYESTYRVTSVDPPELVRFVKEKHPDVIREVPRWSEKCKNEKLRGKPVTMWNLIPEKYIPPTRRFRYCCERLKESGGVGRMTVTGVRWAESPKRRENQGIATIATKSAAVELGNSSDFRSTKSGVVLANDNADSRRLLEHCYRKHKTMVNPIIEWEDDDVWEFIRAHGIPYCELYDQGFSRLGCIGCPLAQRKSRERELARWPKYKEAYLRSFDRLIQRRKERHEKDPSKPVWVAFGREYENVSATDVYNWWLEYDILPGQVDLLGDDEEDDEE